jgi:hypothetical protein
VKVRGDRFGSVVGPSSPARMSSADREQLNTATGRQGNRLGSVHCQSTSTERISVQDGAAREQIWIYYLAVVRSTCWDLPRVDEKSFCSRPKGGTVASGNGASLPRIAEHLLHRPELDGRLSQWAPLTIVRGLRGYGKTTAVAAFLERQSSQDVTAVWVGAGSVGAGEVSFEDCLSGALRSARVAPDPAPGGGAPRAKCVRRAAISAFGRVSRSQVRPRHRQLRAGA